MRPFRQSEMVRNVNTGAVGRTTDVVQDCTDGECDCVGGRVIPVAYEDANQILNTHVVSLEHIQLYADGRILRDGNGWFEITSATDGARYGSLGDAIAVLKESLDGATRTV